VPIEVVNFRPYGKNTLRGFATVRLTSVNLEIRDIAVHEKSGQSWLSVPSRPYETEDGETKYSYIVKFYEKATWEKFQTTVLEEIDKLQPATADPVQGDDGPPF
jgi:DNA-binding cell septation regulator SpoVG